MRRLARRLFVAADAEAAQPLGELPRDLTDRGMAPPPIGIGEAVEEGRGGGGERHFQMDGEDIVSESGHLSIRTKWKH